MQRKWVKYALLILLCLVVVSLQNARANSGNIVEVMSKDARLDELSAAIRRAGLEGMLSGPGPYTILAPIDGTLGSITNDREFVLYHTIQGRVGFGRLRNQPTWQSALGPSLHIENQGGVAINGEAQLVSIDLPASNGVIHILAKAVSPNNNTSNNNSWNNNSWNNAQPSEPPVNPLIAADAGPVHLPDQHNNPAFVSGGRIGYRAGVYAASTSCKGLTWTLLKQESGVSYVGSDRKSNPYRGDTDCGTSLPILCFNRDLLNPPSTVYSDGWSYGQVRVTAPVQGYRMKSREGADALCQQAYGDRWRIAEYHDASIGRSVGAVSGHDFWARGGNLPTGVRFWIAINDQPANPWNSVIYPGGNPGGNGYTVLQPGDDPAFDGNRAERMSQERAAYFGRPFCKGMTFVIHRQTSGKVQVGADRSTNPFFGDRDCTQAHPLLCIRVDGSLPPSGGAGFNFSLGWAGGQVRATAPVSGNQISTRDQANEMCQAQFGATWRMASFHDGALGTSGTGGWAFWAYGNLEPGHRYWVANNDQRANPWNR